MLRMLFVAAIFAALAVSGAARADTTWLSGTTNVVSKDGRWYIGTGAAGGAFNMPNWNSTAATRVPNTALAPNVGPVRFSANVGFVAPGATLGYVFRDGSLPAWMGQRVRVSFTGSYIGGWGSDRTSTVLSPSSRTYYTTVDGRFGAANGSNNAFVRSESLKIDQSGFELALRLASDFPVSSGMTLTPSLGIFGGHTRTNFDFAGSLASQQFGINTVAHTITQRLTGWKAGLDAGLGMTVRPWRNIALTLAGRGGVYWTRARLNSSDCYQSGVGVSQCTTAQGAAFTGVQYATSAQDSGSAVGFVGTVHGAISYYTDGMVLSFGGFFSWQSAIAGVRNPVNAVGNGPALGSQITGPASVRFAGGWKAGGFVTLRIFLN